MKAQARLPPPSPGCRRWPWLVRWFETNLDRSMCFFFGSFRIIRDGGSTGDLLCPPINAPVSTQQQAGITSGCPVPIPVDSRRYIFGFHPHGLYPTGAGLLPLSPAFRSAFPGTSPVTLVRDHCHFYCRNLPDCQVSTNERCVTSPSTPPLLSPVPLAPTDCQCGALGACLDAGPHDPLPLPLPPLPTDCQRGALGAGVKRHHHVGRDETGAFVQKHCVELPGIEACPQTTAAIISPHDSPPSPSVSAPIPPYRPLHSLRPSPAG